MEIEKQVETLIKNNPSWIKELKRIILKTLLTENYNYNTSGNENAKLFMYTDKDADIILKRIVGKILNQNQTSNIEISNQYYMLFSDIQHNLHQ